MPLPTSKKAIQETTRVKSDEEKFVDALYKFVDEDNGVAVLPHTFYNNGSPKAALAIRCRSRQRKLHTFLLEDVEMLAALFKHCEAEIVAAAEASQQAVDVGIVLNNGELSSAEEKSRNSRRRAPSEKKVTKPESTLRKGGIFSGLSKAEPATTTEVQQAEPETAEPSAPSPLEAKMKKLIR